MSNIIKFPAPDARRGVEPQCAALPVGATDGALKRATCAFGRGLWMIFAISWPLLKFVFTVDLLWQFGRMMWFWDKPGTYAGWTFTLHFLAFSACLYFLATYRPKGFED